MKFVLCDDDLMLRSMVDGVVTGCGHEVIGVTDTTSEAVSLLLAGKPDAVIVDITVGNNTDFDVVATANDIGARAIVFSFNADADRLSAYAVPPVVVHKPDFAALEEVVARLTIDDRQSSVIEKDRRRRPTRAAQGPAPMGLHDAQAFYEALNNAGEGDTLASIDIPDVAMLTESDSIAARVARHVRETDRVLLTSTSLKILLAGGGTEGTASLLARLGEDAVLPPDAHVHSVVIGHDEGPGDAFDRLKRGTVEPG